MISFFKNENGKYQFIRSNNIVEKQTFYDLAIDHTRELVSTACQDRMIRLIFFSKFQLFICLFLEFIILKMVNEFEHLKVQ